jgi:hypothetical protein
MEGEKGKKGEEGKRVVGKVIMGGAQKRER